MTDISNVVVWVILFSPHWFVTNWISITGKKEKKLFCITYQDTWEVQPSVHLKVGGLDHRVSGRAAELAAPECHGRRWWLKPFLRGGREEMVSGCCSPSHQLLFLKNNNKQWSKEREVGKPKTLKESFSVVSWGEWPAHGPPGRPHLRLSLLGPEHTQSPTSATTSPHYAVALFSFYAHAANLSGFSSGKRNQKYML